MENKKKSLGEKRVRTDFNVTKNAEAIEEWKRLKSFVMTSIEESVISTIKAATI